MDELKTIPVHSALNRPNLFLGGERELMLLLGLMCALLVFIALTLPTIIMGAVIWIVFSSLLRMMAKSDPLMSKIYIKQIKYKSYYPAHSTPFRLEK
jgi:type IV secretion system protein VirB3